MRFEFGISGHQASLDDTSAALHSSADQWLRAEGERVKSPLYERPGSADTLTPLSDASEAWFTGEEDFYSDEEFEEKLARRSPMEMTTQITVHSDIRLGPLAPGAHVCHQ